MEGGKKGELMNKGTYELREEERKRGIKKRSSRGSYLSCLSVTIADISSCKYIDFNFNINISTTTNINKKGKYEQQSW
jgi:hypothetical protein